MNRVASRPNGRPPRGAPGFTLMELLVAIGLTGVVAVGLYSLSMVASQTFQQQQRISEMQLRLRSAVESLRADIARAGYMATPNSATDIRVCPRPSSALQAVTLTQDSGSSNPTHSSTDNAYIVPARLTMLGNYVNTDEYLIMGINGATVYLQQHAAAFVRVPDAATFERTFLGRTVRIMGTNGTMQFGLVNSVSYASPSGGTYPSITLSAAPLTIGGAVSASTSVASCGLPGLGVGATIAPVSMVQYRIASVASSQANAYRGSTGNPFLVGKTDLVRTEFNMGAMGPTEIAGSERIVAEYAVDFDVSAVVRQGTAANGDPSYTQLGWGAATNFSLLAAVANSGTPEVVRSLVVRLSVRDRTADPDFGWVARSASTQPLTRFRLQNLPGAARVRTVITEVAMPNIAYRNL